MTCPRTKEQCVEGCSGEFMCPVGHHVEYSKIVSVKLSDNSVVVFEQTTKKESWYEKFKGKITIEKKHA